jgi:hypothetical protein
VGHTIRCICFGTRSQDKIWTCSQGFTPLRGTLSYRAFTNFATLLFYKIPLCTKLSTMIPKIPPTKRPNRNPFQYFSFFINLFFVARTRFELVQLVCLLEQVIPMVATHTLRLPISPPDYVSPPWDYWWVDISVFYFLKTCWSYPLKTSNTTGRECVYPFIPRCPTRAVDILRNHYLSLDSKTLSTSYSL